MSGATDWGFSDNLAAAALHFLPAFVWIVLTFEYAQLSLRSRPGRLFPLITAMSGLMALHWTLHCVIELTPTQLGGRLPLLHEVLLIAIAVAQVLPAAVFRHLVPYMAIREHPPSATWLVVNYGAAALAFALAVLGFLMVGEAPGTVWLSPIVPIYAYIVIAVPLGIVEMSRLRRRGDLPPFYEVQGVAFWTTAIAVPALLALLLMVGLGSVLTAAVTPARSDPLDISMLAHTSFGLVIAAAFGVVILGEFLRSLAIGAVTIATAAAVFALPELADRIHDVELRHLSVVAAVAGIVVLLGPGLSWTLALLDRAVFRQHRRTREALERFLQTLSPEIGVLECCRRAAVELVRFTQVDGAAILLDREAPRSTAVGELEIAPLEATWPTGALAARLPSRAFGLYAVREPALREAMAAARIALVVPLRSPRRIWGHLFITERLLGRITRGEHHIRALEAFADRLSLLLDSAELLERALAVERSLAHAERLAAIGELSARIAHEIRNPAAAARSLAQQLVREPTPFTRELEVILAELERIERQVSALLRYARREEFRFAPVDLGRLLHATVLDLRSRIEAAGVSLRIDGEEDLTASIDAEKLRQVLVNLIENALDELAAAPGPRHLTLRVARVNGTAQLEVIDSGRGAPAELLERLFEPFFSLKEHGTGLGLAIARRVVEAHGGSLLARSPGPRGMTFELVLPLDRPART
jgi:signal transduction histidine kinase